MCKKLNGPVLKSLKRFGPKSKKKIVGPDPDQNFVFASSWAGLEPKFRSLFRAARGFDEIFIFISGWVEIATLRAATRADL